MHYLHRILVYLPDVGISLETADREDAIESVRRYAEEETEPFCDQVFDWRETGTAGRWSSGYSKNVVFAQDDLDQFSKELVICQKNQREEIDTCLQYLRQSAGADLASITDRIWGMQAHYDEQGGLDFMMPFYLHRLAALLYGEYISDSFFYNTHEHTARLYPADIEVVKKNPEDWALAAFDYHN